MKNVILIMLALALSCFAQTTDNQRTNGGVNGRFWNALNDSERLYFLIGFDEAMGLAHPFSEKDYFSQDAPYGDVVKGIDRFYQEPENLRFPVSDALQIFRMKVNGATQADIETKLAEMRREIKNAEEILKKKQ